MESSTSHHPATILLKGFDPSKPGTRFAEDPGLEDCKGGCSCDGKDKIMPTKEQYCIVCNATTSGRGCSGCGNAVYCSRECQKEDWSTHRMLCKQYGDVLKAARPSPRHFRALIFPPEESGKVQFLWVEVKDETRLLAHHSIVDEWKTTMEGRYKMDDKTKTDHLTVHALSNDLGLQGKRFGHGIRVAFWPPPSGELGYREDFNRTAFALSYPRNGRKIGKNISSLKYGPVIAFAYTLNAKFEFDRMDDMTTNDFRHVVDYLRNSQWNPTIGDVKRYPGTTLPAQFIPDIAHVPREGEKCTENPCSGDPDGLCRKIGAHVAGLRQDIATTINVPQACRHSFCNHTACPVPEMCQRGYVWHTFLLGPAMLGLPWIGRNAVVGDIDNMSGREARPPLRWNSTVARYLRQSFHVNGKMAFISPMNMTDGLIVYHAFGEEIDFEHIDAYTHFVYSNLQQKDNRDRLVKAEFIKYWELWKESKAKFAKRGDDPDYPLTPAEYRALPSPYDVAASASSVLAEDMAKMLGCVTDLFADPEFRVEFQESEYAVLEEDYPLGQWFPKNLKPYSHQYEDGGYVILGERDTKDGKPGAGAQFYRYDDPSGLERIMADLEIAMARKAERQNIDVGDSKRTEGCDPPENISSSQHLDLTELGVNEVREAERENTDVGDGNRSEGCDPPENVSSYQYLDLAALAAESLNVMERSEMMKLG